MKLHESCVKKSILGSIYSPFSPSDGQWYGPQNKQGMFKIQEVSKHEGYLFEGWHFVQTYFKPLKSF